MQRMGWGELSSLYVAQANRTIEALAVRQDGRLLTGWGRGRNKKKKVIAAYSTTYSTMMIED